MTSNAKVILGLLAAGAAGVAIGMLLAPQKGSDTRSSIKDTISDLNDKVTDFISEGKEKLADASEEIRAHANGIKKEVKAGIDHTKQALS
ncbi:MAG: YtxH domain-containing protein [Bacteroidota bacterium]